MATTSLKLPEDLKKRAASAAQKQGLSPHAFMVNAIEQAAFNAENRARFIADARSTRNQMLKTGNGFDAGEVHAFLKARIAGRKAVRPKAKNWRS